jgi:hypothetical protein
MSIKETDFFAPGELETLVRCKQFVAQELQAKYKTREYFKGKSKSTKFIEIEIARMEYALGIRKSFPCIKAMLEEDQYHETVRNI